MRTAATILTLSLFTLSAGAAEVYRTIDAQGNVVYSDRPEDASSVRVAVAVTQPRASVPCPQNRQGFGCEGTFALVECTCGSTNVRLGTRTQAGRMT